MGLSKMPVKNQNKNLQDGEHSMAKIPQKKTSANFGLGWAGNIKALLSSRTVTLLPGKVKDRPHSYFAGFC